MVTSNPLERRSASSVYDRCVGNISTEVRAFAHEFGHVYGLGHTGPDQDCMRFGFYDAATMCRFSAANRAAVRNDPANVGWLDLELDIEPDPDPPHSARARPFPTTYRTPSTS